MSEHRPTLAQKRRKMAEAAVEIPPNPMGHAKVQTGQMDKILFYITIALAVVGLVTVYSASATEAMDHFGNSLYFVERQGLFFIVGFALMFFLSRVSFLKWANWTYLIAGIVIALLCCTMFFGVEAYGAERWVRIFGIQFQPSELGKISVLLLLAQGLSHPLSKKRVGPLLNLLLIGVTIVLIIKQPSLSMTIILSSVTAGMMLISGISPWLVFSVGGISGALLVEKVMHTPYQLRRITGWWDPLKDPQDTGYNLIQSLYAIGSGGLFGTGLGMSHQKLYYLPFQYTDFIFAVWAEEWGLIGCLLLIGLFCVLLYRGVVIAKTCRSPFGQLLAMGITMMLALQVLINLCVATGLFPVTGVTLPLVSYGGTSVLVTMAMLGILLNISRDRFHVSSLPTTPSQ